MNRPAWQTEELADEWPDEEEGLSAEQQGNNDRAPHSDGEEDSFVEDADEGEISFTAPLPSHIHTTPSPYASPGRAAFATSVSLRASASFRGSRSTSQGAGYATAPTVEGPKSAYSIMRYWRGFAVERYVELCVAEGGVLGHGGVRESGRLKEGA